MKRQRHLILFIVCFLPHYFNINEGSWAVLSSELEDHDSGNSYILFVVTEIVREGLYQLRVLKSMGQDSPWLNLKASAVQHFCQRSGCRGRRHLNKSAGDQWLSISQ